MKKEDLLNKIEKIKETSNKFTVLVTVVKLPTGALETIVNYQNLEEKIQYLIFAYDEDLRLKTYTDIQLVDFIIQ